MTFDKRRYRPPCLSQLWYLQVGVFPVLLYCYCRALWARILKHSNSQQLSAWQQPVFCFGSSCVCCHRLLLHNQSQPMSSFSPWIINRALQETQEPKKKCFFTNNGEKWEEWNCSNVQTLYNLHWEINIHAYLREILSLTLCLRF